MELLSRWAPEKRKLMACLLLYKHGHGPDCFTGRIVFSRCRTLGGLRAAEVVHRDRQVGWNSRVADENISNEVGSIK
jgi:hypothetical protein